MAAPRTTISNPTERNCVQCKWSAKQRKENRNSRQACVGTIEVHHAGNCGYQRIEDSQPEMCTRKR